MAENKKKKNTLTCEWRESKGRMNPLPRCMAVQLSDLALDSVKPFEMMRHQKTTGKKTSSGLQGNGLAVVLNEIGRSALSLACCVYSVPLHATYIPKNAHLTFFFLFISTLIFVLLIFARSRKLLGHWAKPFPLTRLCLKKKETTEKEKYITAGLLVPCNQMIGFPIMP